MNGSAKVAEVVVLVGLQASGKTSFFRERFAETHVHVSKDNFPKHRRPAKRQERELCAALEAGDSVVVDNTNPTAEERLAVVTVAQEYGARVIAFYFESDVPTCRDRNEARESPVPLVGLYSTIKKLTRPTREEGFDEIYHVRLTSMGFEVEPL